MKPMAAAPSSESTPGALTSDLGWALGVLFRTYLRLANQVTAEVPGGPRGYQVLTAAVGEEPSTQLALANRLGIDRTVMTYLLDDIEKAGLVERRSDPSDRRARRIVATEQGRALMCQLETKLRGAEEHILAGLPEAERATFRDLVQRLADQANAYDPVDHACTVVTEIAANDAC
jgi:DNA-binding MarR family transcriptional regulator